MIDTVVVVIEGGLPTTAVAPVEILGSAGHLWENLQGVKSERQFDVQTASLRGGATPTLVPLTLETEHPIESIDGADLVVVSAGSGDLELECERNAELPPLLGRAYEQGTAIAGICTGVVQLAEAGLLDGRPATTHWAILEDCRDRYPHVDWRPEQFVTESNEIFCSGGVYSAVDLSLYLVERYCGHETAMRTAKALLLQTPRSWQAGYDSEAPDLAHEDEQIQEAQEWLFDNFDEQIEVADLAARVGA